MDETENRRFGRLLRAHRVAAGLSQEELAERAGLSRRTLTDLERGVTTTPYRETVALLADALDLTESDRTELENAVHRARTPSIAGDREAAIPRPPVAADVDALLETKLAIPPARPALVPRPQLIERLQAGLHGPLTLLSAPAGSGKTTLLSAWRTTLEGRATPLAWVSLDEGDNAPGRFWRYILTALDRAAPGISAAARAQLRSADALPTETMLTALVNGLAAQAEDIVMVLDDYHLIEAEPIHRTLTFLLEHLPPCLHVLLATRADPPLPLARLRARGAICELRAADLRFSLEEAGAFFATVMELTLSPGAVAALEARTEGWIAGLQLAGLSLQGRGAEETAGFIADFTGSHRYIVDYLLDEVLLRQPEEVQRFLLHTCILDRLCAPLCAAVLQGENPPAERIAAGQRILELLERNNVFVVALDDERRWYRFHHLFADALRQRQSGHPSIPDASVLYRRASAWFAQHDLVGEAISYALAGGSYDAAADLIPRARMPVAFRGKMLGLSAWLRILPEATLRARPELAAQQAWILAEMRDPQGAEEYRRHAEVALATTPQTYSAAERENLQTHVEALRAIIAFVEGDADRAVHQALAVLGGPAGSGGPGSFDGRTGRGAAAFALGLAHLSQGAASRAAEAFSDVAVANRAHAESVLMAMASVGAACAHRLSGNLDRAHAACEQAIAWSTAYSFPVLLDCNLYTGLADALRERNELDAALVERIEEGLRMERELNVAGTGRWIEWHACNLLVLARIRQAQGALDGALALVHEAHERLDHFGALSFAAILAAFEAQLYLAQGNIDAAVRRLQRRQTPEGPPRIGLTPQYFLYAAEHLEIAPVQILIAQGRASGDPAPIHRALTLLDRVQEKAGHSDRVWLRAKTFALQALARRVLGDLPTAFAALDRALALAEPGWCLRLFLDEGTPMAGLLRERRTRGDGPGEGAALLDALIRSLHRDIRNAAWPGSVGADHRALAEAVTERELEVLRLLAAGRSTPEIARALYVEVNTVRTHVKHLYGKLDVHSRDQAVWRAHELGLL